MPDIKTMEIKEEFRPLPDEYTHSGTKFVKYKRGNRGVIYHHSSEDSGEIFEVFVIKISKATVMKMGGKEIPLPKRERVPGNENFGEWAWCTTTLTRAELIFSEIESGIRPQSIDPVKST